MIIQMSRKKSFEQISIDVKYRNQKFLMKIFCSPLLREKNVVFPLFVAKNYVFPPNSRSPPPPLVVINDTSPSITCHRYVRHSGVQCSLTFSLLISLAFPKSRIKLGKQGYLIFWKSQGLLLSLQALSRGNSLFVKT